MKTSDHFLIVKKPLTHVFVWLVFICCDSGFVYYVGGVAGYIPALIFFYTCNIGIFYCHLYLLNVTLGKTARKYSRAVLPILAELAVFTAVKALWEYYHPGTQPFPDPYLLHFKKAVVTDLWRNIYFAGLSTIIWASVQAAESRRRATASELRLARAQNAYLQQQLNPHLLFNTLNFIYSSVQPYSEQGGRVVLLLAGIMRFTLEEVGADGKIELRREVAQLQNLVEINRSRFHYPLEISLELPDPPASCRVIPLLLLTLSENIFKHGDFNGHPATISLTVSEQGNLHFVTANHKRRPGTAPANGLGLRNTRLRLDHAYPGAYTLTIHETPDTYRCELMLQL